VSIAIGRTQTTQNGQPRIIALPEPIIHVEYLNNLSDIVLTSINQLPYANSRKYIENVLGK
jgi:hypothetical protein